METIHNISTARNESHFRIRSIVMVAGIVIAIICSLISLKDIHSTEAADATVQTSMKISKPASVDLLVNTVSTIRSFSDHIH